MGVSAVVGRADALDRIRGLLDRHELLPAAVVVAGGAGIGKTAVWSAGVHWAGTAGFRVLSSRATQAEASWSFSGLADLIRDDAVPLLPQLPPMQRRALEGALLLGDSEAEVQERAVAAAVLHILQLLSRGRPLLVAVDDLQWLDAASLAALRYALPRLLSEPVAALIAVRDVVPDWLLRGFGSDHLETVQLGPLSLAVTHELLRTRLGLTVPRPVLRQIWETSGGNPFYALELGQALQRSGGPIRSGADLRMPASLDALLQERIDGVSAAALRCARVVAALADPVVELVEAALGTEGVTDLEAALASRVVALDEGRLRLTHPLLGPAISARTSPTARRALHARLATIVATTEARARHLAQATPAPDRAVAALVETAAQTAHARGAPAAAAELTEQALRLTPVGDSANLARRTLTAADRHDEAGDAQRGIALLEHALITTPAGVGRARLLAHLAAITSHVADPHQAVALLHAALRETEGDGAVEASIHLQLADLSRGTTDREDGLAHADTAVRLARGVADDALLCQALSMYGLLHFSLGLGPADHQMQEALALERSLPGYPLADAATSVVVHQLVMSCDLEVGRRELLVWRNALSARDDPAEAHALWLLSMLELRAGNWELGAEYADTALTLGAQFGYATRPSDELPAAAIAAHRGQIAAARTRSERALALARATDVRIAQSGHRWVLGFIELSLDNPAAALVHLRGGWAIRDEVRMLEPGHRFELADTLDALIAVGDLDEAERLLQPWEERSRSLDRAWALAILGRCRALVLAARGDVAGARECFEEALVQHDRANDPFQRARTLLAQGVTQRRTKQRAAARHTLEQALEIFERLGAPLWSAKARAELARIGGRPPSSGELTEAERRVVAGVASGLRNREVAAHLFLSEHTVETVLSRAYRKLGVRSRSELARLLGPGTEQDPPANS
jgi:DNA-binding CsgD family transcriptional regulator